MENKNSFFLLVLPLENSHRKGNEYYTEQLDNAVDIILGTMGVKNKSYRFINKNSEEIIYLFRTETRKRKGQIIKCCETNIPKVAENQYFSVQALTKTGFELELQRMKRNENYQITQEPTLFNEYKGDDLVMFDNPKNWYSWQKEIYNKLFDKDGILKQPDPRKIISLVDEVGNSGKSAFYKYLNFKYPSQIGRLGYGSAGQLRSSVMNIGPKPLYIVDLARTKGRDDRQEDLLSILEDVKNGCVWNNFRGSGYTLMMAPPSIVVSSNYHFNYSALSEDRWEVYEITRNYNLKTIDVKKKLKDQKQKRGKSYTKK